MTAALTIRDSSDAVVCLDDRNAIDMYNNWGRTPPLLQPDATPEMFLLDLSIMVLRRPLGGPGTTMEEFRALEKVLQTVDEPITAILPNCLEALGLPVLAAAVKTINERNDGTESDSHGFTLEESYQIIGVLQTNVLANVNLVGTEVLRSRYSDTITGALLRIVDRLANGDYLGAAEILRRSRPDSGLNFVVDDQLVVDIYHPLLVERLERRNYREAIGSAECCKRELRGPELIAQLDGIIALCTARIAEIEAAAKK